MKRPSQTTSTSLCVSHASPTLSTKVLFISYFKLIFFNHVIEYCCNLRSQFGKRLAVLEKLMIIEVHVMTVLSIGHTLIFSWSWTFHCFSSPQHAVVCTCVFRWTAYISLVWVFIIQFIKFSIHHDHQKRSLAGQVCKEVTFHSNIDSLWLSQAWVSIGPKYPSNRGHLHFLLKGFLKQPVLIIFLKCTGVEVILQLDRTLGANPDKCILQSKISTILIFQQGNLILRQSNAVKLDGCGQDCDIQLIS